MSDKVDIRISISLDPGTWREMEGYNDETAKFDGGVVSAINDAWVTLGKVHEARKHAEGNPAWTPEQRILIVGKEAEKQKLRILQRIDRADQTVAANIAHTEAQLMEPLIEKAGLGSVNREVRAHVKGLKDRSEREKFMRAALDRDDEATLAAVVGAQPFLSGLDPLDRDYYLRLYHEKKRPDLVRRLDLMNRIRDRLGSIGSIIHTEFAEAIGAKPGIVGALNAANERALEALKIEPTV